MPAIVTCPRCGFCGNHGFVDAVGGLTQFWHTTANGATCIWYSGHQRDYCTLSDAFEAEVAPRHLTDDIWIAAWRARIAGHERKAQRLFKKWAILERIQ